MSSSQEKKDSELTLRDVLDEFQKLSTEVKTFDEKFNNYQKATQSLVNLAFGLIASATIAIIITTVFK